MLACNVSQRARRAAISVAVAETVTAADAVGTSDYDATIAETASAVDVLTSPYEAAVAEAAAAADFPIGTLSVVTSYANTGGSGNRTAIIAISTTIAAGTGTVAKLIDGTTANDYWWVNSQSGREIVFDFGVAASKVIDEFKWNQDVALNPLVGHGTWRLEGSNDGSSYATFPESFLLGIAAGDQTVPITNVTGYRYYRLRQMSGNISSTPFVREITFKISP